MPLARPGSLGGGLRLELESEVKYANDSCFQLAEPEAIPQGAARYPPDTMLARHGGGTADDLILPHLHLLSLVPSIFNLSPSLPSLCLADHSLRFQSMTWLPTTARSPVVERLARTSTPSRPSFRPSRRGGNLISEYGGIDVSETTGDASSPTRSEACLWDTRRGPEWLRGQRGHQQSSCGA